MCVCDQDLLDIVTEEDEIDAAETHLGDDKEQVHRPPETQRERSKQSQREKEKGKKTDVTFKSSDKLTDQAGQKEYSTLSSHSLICIKHKYIHSLHRKNRRTAGAEN